MGYGNVVRPEPVRSKTDFVKRYAEGEFGNASPTWSILDDFIKHLISIGYLPFRGIPSLVFPQRYSLRSSRPGDTTRYNLTGFDCLHEWMKKEEKGLKGWYASEMAPTEHTVIQGEVFRSPYDGLCLFYSTGHHTMKEGLKKNGRQATGIKAKLMLEHCLPIRDYEWLMWLMDEQYPDHVVEFSTYDVEWGTVPGFKTVYWEVRHGY